MASGCVVDDCLDGNQGGRAVFFVTAGPEMPAKLSL